MKVTKCMLAVGMVAVVSLAGMAQAQSVLGEGCFPLLAGQTIDAGSVCVKVEGSALKVTFVTTPGWELTEAHLWIGNQITDLPQNKSGNPVPGQFPWKSGDITGLTEYTFSIPLSNPAISFSCPGPDILYFMAAHAAVRRDNGDGTYQTETGWSDGSPITSQGNWATFSTFTLTCNDGGGGETECETAFAMADANSQCFIPLGFQRWGWTNGPLAAGTYTMNIYAGAGQCDTTKGMFAGTLTIAYNGSVATITYAMLPGWTMEETQLYVGNARLPLYKQGKNLVETVAPGQYPYMHSSLEGAATDTYSVNVTGSIYVVAHAVTCHVVQ